MPSPAAALAAVALFFALSGTVVAAVRIARDSVGSAQIKDGSLHGTDLAANTISGTQIDEATLGVVPRAGSAGTATAAQAAAEAQHAASATRADTAGSATTAGNAKTLGGKTAADFADSSEVFPVAVGFAGGETKTIVARDGLRFYGKCQANVLTGSGDARADILTVYVDTDKPGASYYGPKGAMDGSATDDLEPGVAENKRKIFEQAANPGTAVVRVPTGSASGSSANGTSIFLGSTGSVRLGFNTGGSVCWFSAPVMIASLK